MEKVMEQEVQFFSGDEVAKIRNGHLAFGTLLHKTPQKVSDEPKESTKELWKVDWNDGDGKQDVNASQLTLTDRPISIGCKVRRKGVGENGDGLEGICRNVSIFADLRFIGTNTLLESVSISAFTHLKQFQQKSVVYLNGWLGIIAETERYVTVAHSNNLYSLSSFTTSHAQMVELPWVNERICRNSQMRLSRAAPIASSSGTIIPASHSSASTTTTASNPNATYSEWKFLKDLSVIKVKVNWQYQLDLMCPDHPPEVLQLARLSQLSLVMEQSGTDVPFQVGNLGRFFLRAHDELIGFKEYQRNFIKKYLPTKLEFISKEEPYPERAYLIKPEEAIRPDKAHIVEIVHLSGTADVMWQDGTMGFERSVDLVNVVDERMIISVLNAMDFAYSHRVQLPMENSYAVVQRTDLKGTDLKEKTVLLKVLTTDNPPKVIHENLLLKAGEVFPHPRYRYFNETNSIVVNHQGNSQRIGHVRRSNFSGKIQVYWIDTKREEWCWPTECSLYIVRGFDLECIISLTNDADEVSSCPATRFQKVLEKLHIVKGIWENIDNWEDGKLAESIENLKYALDACLNAEKVAGLAKETYISIEKFSDTTAALASLSSANAEVNYREPSFVASMQEYCASMHVAALLLFQYLTVQEQSLSETSNGARSPSTLSWSSSGNNPSPSQPVAMEVDEAGTYQNHTNNGGWSCSEIFNQPVQMLGDAPTTHTYAMEPFEQGQYQVLLKIIKNEMTNFHRSRASGIKVLSYHNRLDLFSIAICGPEKTPYEDTLCLFDAKLPQSYNAVPPKVNFLPYGAGRLNPNLYESGKVCLSLLGTWQGQEEHEGWTKDSNLLQVLISIQGLILVSETFHNEPGYEAEKFTDPVRTVHRLEYNRALMPKICVMMLNQLANPGQPWVEDIHKFYQESLTRFIGRWRKMFEIASKRPEPKKEQFLAALSDYEKPGFEIYPFSAAFTKSMTGYLTKLEAAHQKLCSQGSNTEEPIEVEEESDQVVSQ